jgi:inner membrane protein
VKQSSDFQPIQKLKSLVLIGNPKIFSGASIDKMNTQSSFPWLMIKSQQAIDVERFKLFSDGYIAINPKNKNQILDIRYSTLPNEIGGLWGIELSKEVTELDNCKIKNQIFNGVGMRMAVLTSLFSQA